jgi:hypothetical protein
MAQASLDCPFQESDLHNQGSEWSSASYICSAVIPLPQPGSTAQASARGRTDVGPIERPATSTVGHTGCKRLASVEDRPTNLGTPRRLVGSVLRPTQVVLTNRTLHRERMPGHMSR